VPEDILRNLQGGASVTVEDLTAALEGGRVPPAVGTTASLHCAPPPR
jgi:hypothetical protein